jgi:minor curlin subunit
MKTSIMALLISAPLMMTACSKGMSNGIAVEDLSFAGAQSIPSDQHDEGTTEVVDLGPGEQIDEGGNLVDDEGEVILPSCSKPAGASNYAGVEQSGSNNQAVVYQSGSGNVACIVQSGSNNHASVTQVGSGNSASVVQR